MPLPLLIGLAAAVGAAAAVKHYDASEMFDKVDNVVTNAEKRHNYVVKRLKTKSTETEEVMANLGLLKLEIQSTSIKKFVCLYKELRQIDFKDRNPGEASLDKFFTPAVVNQMEKVSYTASEAIGVGVKSLGTGGLAALGVQGLVASFGTASTGTAIATLSGAAAQNATLAALGGGSLATAGGGMLAGSLVLGGVLLGPAILISGFARASKAEQALTAAKKYQAEVDVAIEKIQVGITALEAIQVRVEEITVVLSALNLRFYHLLSEMERIIIEKKSQKPSAFESVLQNLGLKPKKISFKDLNRDEKAICYIAYHFARAIIAVLEVKILDQEHGTVTVDSEIIVNSANEIITVVG